jgi:hypothetical protein
MKKLKCEICLIQATCTEICVDFAYQMMQIDHEIKMNEKYVLSNNKHKRKRLKDRDLSRYTTLINKFNRGTQIRESIWDRQFVKLGLSRSSTTSSYGESTIPSVSSSKISKMPLYDYIKKVYLRKRKEFDKETALRVKADNIILRRINKCYKTRRSP